MECPRWRLTEPHYLNVPQLPDGTDVEWEHKETSRESGRAVRKLFPVPLLLDTKDPADFNYPELGDIIVCHDVEGARKERRDIAFIGDPTPGMEPLNDEAQAITDACRERWENPIESLPANGGMNPAEQAFMAKMMEAFEKVAQPPIQVVPQAQYDELKERLAKLEAALAAQKPVESTGARRV